MNFCAPLRSSSSKYLKLPPYKSLETRNSLFNSNNSKTNWIALIPELVAIARHPSSSSHNPSSKIVRVGFFVLV